MSKLLAKSRTNIGIHLRSSIRWPFKQRGHVRHSARQAAAATTTSGCHGAFVEADTTLLESGSPPTP